MANNDVWESDFGSIFRQRYDREVTSKFEKDVSDILKKSKVNKGIGGAIGGGGGAAIGSTIGNAIAPGIGGLVGSGLGGAVGGGVGSEFDKMKKEKGIQLPLSNPNYKPKLVSSIEQANRERSKQLGYKGVSDYKKRAMGGAIGASASDQDKMTSNKDLRQKSLGSVVKSIDHLLKALGDASNAGLNTKNVKQKPDGKAFPTKPAPKPITKKTG